MKLEDVKVGEIYRFAEYSDLENQFCWSGFCQITRQERCLPLYRDGTRFQAYAIFDDLDHDETRVMYAKELDRLATKNEAKEFLMRTIT